MEFYPICLLFGVSIGVKPQVRVCPLLGESNSPNHSYYLRQTNEFVEGRLYCLPFVRFPLTRVLWEVLT